ncbi:hypothetical protein PIB30_015925 [Stylosanthes scabra]|uniref:Uncharacterized protein n=1 Tax=Stylosanthes scabra TaxID=79078 RepID=A0ABU6U9V0_9FABA|nr:hypothetical protein [Stylosanthes scabra]
MRDEVQSCVKKNGDRLNGVEDGALMSPIWVVIRELAEIEAMLTDDDAWFYVSLHDSEEIQKDSSDFHAASKKVITREELEKKA